jgi:hypothetical protein
MFDSKVLAGLIDTDGYLVKVDTTFVLQTKRFSKISSTFQITGFQVQDIQSVMKTCTNAPRTKTMSSLPIVYIGGDDLEDIPYFWIERKSRRKEATLRSRTLQILPDM